MTKATKRAIEKYGEDKCRNAYRLNHEQGEGPMLIGGYGKGCVARANAMIDAGRELATGSREP